MDRFIHRELHIRQVGPCARARRASNVNSVPRRDGSGGAGRSNRLGGIEHGSGEESRSSHQAARYPWTC